jgi:hypothetical protein
VGDHPDLLWIERGAGDTRVRISQIRALQNALRLRPHEAGRRAAVIADAEWLNQEAQNALLRLLEEPPPETSLVLVATTAAGLLATVRSRCQRVAFRPTLASPLDIPENADLVARFDSLGSATLPELLDWAEDYRGSRSTVVPGVEALLATASAWLRRRIAMVVAEPGHDVRRELEAGRVLSVCRRNLAQRNANPQMVAEHALIALHDAMAR